jgi:hypothetical protein
VRQGGGPGSARSLKMTSDDDLKQLVKDRRYVVAFKALQNRKTDRHYPRGLATRHQIVAPRVTLTIEVAARAAKACARRRQPRSQQEQRCRESRSESHRHERLERVPRPSWRQV